MRVIIPLLLAFSLALALGVSHGVDTPAAALPDGLYAVWETPRGSITAELFYESAPLTVANFVGLAEGTIPFTGRPAGRPFYDGLTFHRVVPGFVIQGGDPLGTGQGNPGHVVADEFSPLLKHNATGILSMANAQPNDNGCQFFFTLAPVDRLNYKHSVFGRVVEGLNVLPKIQMGDVMTRVRIVRVGARAESFRANAAAFAALRASTPPIPPRDPALPPLFLAEIRVPLRDGYGGWLNEKLHHYAVTSGVTIRVRMVRAIPPPPESTPGADPLRALHDRLAGDDPLAATLVFTLTPAGWQLCLGDGLRSRVGLARGDLDEEQAASRERALQQSILEEAASLLRPTEPPNRSIDAAVTNLIEVLDRPAALRAAP